MKNYYCPLQLAGIFFFSVMSLGCASNGGGEQVSKKERAEDSDYVTGSNLPRRDRPKEVRTLTKEEAEATFNNAGANTYIKSGSGR